MPIGECTLKITQAIDRGSIWCLSGPKETYSVKGTASRIADQPRTVFLDHRAPGSGELSIYGVEEKDEIFTDVQLCGAAARVGGSSTENLTSHVRHTKQQLFPGRTFLAADFEPGIYAIANVPGTCFKFQVGPDQPRTRQTATKTPTESKSLSVDGKDISFWSSSDAKKAAFFQMESKGYRNTYKIDCAGKRFLWTENVRLSTGEVTGNSAGAEWKPLNPNSTIANAVFDAACR